MPYSAEYEIMSTQMFHSPLDLAGPKPNVDPPALPSPRLCPQPRLMAQKPVTSKLPFLPLPLPSESAPAVSLGKSAFP